MRALIDGDVLVYQCAFAAQYKIYIPDPITAEHPHGWRYKKDVPEGIKIKGVYIVEKEEKALAALDSAIGGIIRATHAKEVSVYLSKGQCFRHKLTPTYKANRVTEKPVYYNLLRQVLTEKYGAVTVESIEADDALSIMHTHLQDRQNSVLCSIDKDLLNTPGYHFNWKSNEFTKIDEIQGKYNFMSQMLTGDVADNITGLHRVGPKTAAKLLACAEDDSGWGKVVKSCYEERAEEFDGNWEKQFMLNRKLLWILRQPAYGVEIDDLDMSRLVADIDTEMLAPSQENSAEAFG